MGTFTEADQDRAFRRWTTSSEILAVERVLAAMESDPLVRGPDHLARHFVDPQSSIYPDSEAKAAAIRSILEQTLPGAYHLSNARTKHIDRVLADEIDGGTRQVVILGAGYDSRPHRFHHHRSPVRFFEVDLPRVQDRKRALTDSLPTSHRSPVTYVARDLEHEDLAGSLIQAGLNTALRTLFVMEGVVYFSPESVFRQNLSSFSRCSPPGSTVVFDFMTNAMLKGREDCHGAREMCDHLKRHGEGQSLVFAIEDDDLTPMLDGLGFRIKSLLDPQSLENAYLMTRNRRIHGRVLGAVRIVHAELKDSSKPRRSII